MMSDADIYDDMNFYITSEKFIVEPNGKEELLVIDRISNNIKVQVKTNQVHQLVATRRICGVIGTIKILAGQYLIVATHRIFIGVINSQAIWRLAGYDIIPYIPSKTHMTPQQKEQNETYINMIKKNLDTPFLYFSYSYDLTHTLQRLHSMPPEFLKIGLFERSDRRFVWNSYVLRNFQSSEMKRFCLPLMMGFVSINHIKYNGHFFTWSIISRRSNKRAGTRLFCRGVDEEGWCANFVETEQIIEYNEEKVSFVQIRGSIPLFWKQTPDLRYKPPPQILQSKDHLTACTKHFDSLFLQYGKDVIVNLVDQKGAEGRLEKAYSNLVSLITNPAVQYEAFDFHSECRKMRWDRLNILIDRLAHEQDEFSVFHLKADGTLLSSQDGVFRTNCIDCLDRTNVVQSLLARRSLTSTLQKLGILKSGQKIDPHSSLDVLFKAVWADNADLISIQYSGTGALKTDFTRTGKRTKMGLANDAVNSLTRYYLNNFNDGFRQDSIDLFLGNYVVNEGEGYLLPLPMKTSKGWKYGTFPSVLLFAVGMFFMATVFPYEYHTENLLFILFWGAMVGVTIAGIFKYGAEFVDWPKLTPSPKIEA